MQTQKFNLNVEIHFENPQYYEGHGHAFESKNILACIPFSTHGTGNETVREIAESVLEDINEQTWFFMNKAENDEKLQNEIINISDKDILAKLLSLFGTPETDKPYEQYYDLNLDETELAEADTYYMGALHIYLK